MRPPRCVIISPQMESPAAPFRTVAQAVAPSRLRLQSADDAVVAEQAAIAAIPAPTGSESKRAAFVASRLAAAGLHRVGIDDAGNAVGIRRGAADDWPVVVCAHLDTVFESRSPITVTRRGPRLCAPGIGDNARGLATMLALADEFAAHLRPAHSIVFAATTGEEGAGDLRGARHLFDTLGRGARAAIAIDGAGDERIVARALGCRRYRVEYRGAGGHSWAAYGTPNAVHAAAGLVTRLTALPLTRRGGATLTVSRIGGGSAINAIPADGWVDVDMRSTSTAELDRLDRHLRVSAREALEEENARRASGTALLAVTITPLSDRPAGEVPDDHPLVQAAASATRYIGRAPELAVASTDANIPISLGIPAVAIGGGGRGGDTHTPHEWYENRDGARGVVRALMLVAAAAGLA